MFYCFFVKNNLIVSKLRENSGFVASESAVGSDEQANYSWFHSK